MSAVRRSTRAHKLTQKGEEYQKERLAAHRAAALFLAAFEKSQDRKIAECKRALAQIAENERRWAVAAAGRRAKQGARQAKEAARRAWEAQKADDEARVENVLDWYRYDFLFAQADEVLLAEASMMEEAEM